MPRTRSEQRSQRDLAVLCPPLAAYRANPSARHPFRSERGEEGEASEVPPSPGYAPTPECPDTNSDSETSYGLSPKNTERGAARAAAPLSGLRAIRALLGHARWFADLGDLDHGRVAFDV